MDRCYAAQVQTPHPTPVHISASQLATFKDCPRKWAFDKLDCVPRADTAATNRGKAIHAEVEAWYKHGTAPESPEAVALLTRLPGRSSDVHAEVDFDYVWPWADGVAAHGFIDLVDLSTNTVYDHKTSKSLARAVKSEAELAVDAQTMLYGLALRVAKPVITEVNLQWTYVQTVSKLGQPPPLQAVPVVQDQAMLDAAIRVWTPVVEELVQLKRRGGRAADVRADSSACYKYGPCHYRDQCVGFPQRRETQPKEPTVALSPEARRAMLAASNAPVASTPPPSNEGHIEPPEAAPAPYREPPSMPPLEALSAALDAIGLAGPPQAVLPPDAQPNVSQNDPPPPPLEPVKGKGRKSKAAPQPSQAIQMHLGTPAPMLSTTSSTFDLEAFVAATVERASREDDILLQLEAARIAMDLLNLRKN